MGDVAVVIKQMRGMVNNIAAATGKILDQCRGTTRENLDFGRRRLLGVAHRNVFVIERA